MTKQQIKHLDNLIAKPTDGKCVWCGVWAKLSNHHIFSRRYQNTRWDKLNLMALCFDCHRRAHDHKPQFTYFAHQKLGLKKYYKLWKKANKIMENNYEDIFKTLKETK